MRPSASGKIHSTVWFLFGADQSTRPFGFCWGPTWPRYAGSESLRQVDLPCKGGKTTLMLAAQLGREVVIGARGPGSGGRCGVPGVGGLGGWEVGGLAGWGCGLGWGFGWANEEGTVSLLPRSTPADVAAYFLRACCVIQRAEQGMAMLPHSSEQITSWKVC